MSSKQGKYVKHGYLIEEICQTYPELNQELEMRMLEFRAQYPTKYRDWYHYELIPALRKLQQRHWSHSTTPESFSRRPYSQEYSSRHDQSYSRIEQKRKAELHSRSHSRIVQGESPGDDSSGSCYKKFHLPHTISKIISNRCFLYGQGKQLSSGLYPVNIPQSQYVTNLEQLKELLPFEDKKCFYEYLQMFIDQSTHLSEKLLYQLVLLHLKLKAQTEPNDISELLLNEYKKMQGEQFLKYSSEETSGHVSRDSMSPHTNDDAMSREQFMSQPQDSFSTDSVALSREQFISQDLTRDDFMSNGPVMSRDQFIAQDQASGDSQLNSLSLQSQDEDKVLHRLRKLLLNGSKHKALRWAIENQEWVSALFIASSMDEATYMSVCSMYIQSIPKNDPLRTCLQVQFGLDLDYQYSDDWGVHLAAILNNAQDASLILRFANILGGVKDICGQHFCYISARIHPDSSTNRNVPYVLVGAENQLLADQIPIRSVMLTMAYDNTLPHLQYYKYYIALNYVKMGAYELSLCLLQNIATVFLNGNIHSPADHYALLSYVYDLSLLIYNRVNPQHIAWINSLAEVISAIQPDIEVNYASNISQEPSIPYQDIQTAPPVYDEPEPSNYSYMPQTELQQPAVAQTVNPVPLVQYNEPQPPSYQEEVSVPQDTGSSQMLPPVETVPSNSMPQVEQAQPLPAFYVPSYSGSMEPGSTPASSQIPQEENLEDLAGPNTGSVGTISIHSKFTFAEDKTDSPPQSATKPTPTENQTKETTVAKPAKTQETGKGSSGGGWLNFLKFGRPKNQMILPDDDKPSIVWDKEKKMWVDVNSDGKSGPSALPPPPKVSQMTTQPQPNATPAPTTNPAPAAMPAAPVSNPLVQNGPGPVNTMPAGPLPSNPLSQNGPAPMKSSAQNGYKKGKAKYVNVLASNG